MDVRALTLAADLVIEGRVLSTRAFEAADGRIETELVLDVDRTFVGADEATRSVRVPGGVLPDGRGMILAGCVPPRAGERVVLFLTPESARGWRLPVGLAQGRFSLVTDGAGRKLAVRSQGRLALADASGTVKHGESSSVMDFAELLAQIESALALREGFGETGEAK